MVEKRARDAGAIRVLARRSLDHLPKTNTKTSHILNSLSSRTNLLKKNRCPGPNGVKWKPYRCKMPVCILVSSIIHYNIDGSTWPTVRCTMMHVIRYTYYFSGFRDRPVGNADTYTHKYASRRRSNSRNSVKQSCKSALIQYLNMFNARLKL